MAKLRLRQLDHKTQKFVEKFPFGPWVKKTPLRTFSATAVTLLGFIVAFTAISPGSRAILRPLFAGIIPTSGNLVVIEPEKGAISAPMTVGNDTAASNNQYVFSTVTNTGSSSSLTPMPLISRGVPVFASSESYPATYANDNTFDTTWRSNGSAAWITYDLSKVPTQSRTKVLLAWYNETNSYDHTVINENAYNMPGSYTIETNTAAGGGTPPTSGWQTAVTVTNNHYHSRQHLIDLNGANWIRLNASTSDGSAQNTDIDFNMDVYDASQGSSDDFIDYGDSITAAAMGHGTANGVASYADLIHARLPNYFPAQENGGIGYLTSGDGANHIASWLQVFPGKYVGLSYGTNDSWGCGDPNAVATTVYNNYVTMIQAVIAAGKTPIVAHMPWSTHSDLATCAVAVNAKLDQLKSAYPQVIQGPDLYTALQNHPEYFVDGVHPNDVGTGVYRQAWANTMVSNVYNSATAAKPSTIAQTNTPSKVLAATSLSPLHVSGNQLQNASGQQVILRGVNRSGTEYACIQGWGIFDGPSDAASIQAMSSWGINGVNIGLNEDCWLGINGVSTQYGGANYQQAIKNYVTLLENNNIYPVISYFWGAPGTQPANGQPTLPDTDHAPAFWTQVANTFKGDNNVLLRLQEEPHNNNNSDTTAAWQCWKNGGSSCSEGYAVNGMQSLVDIIRGTGATNVIQVPGLEYANAMTQFLTYKPTDSQNNLTGVVDVYPDLNPCGNTTCYNNVYAPIIAQMPFMAGEFGESVNGNICSVSASNTFMNWMDQHNSGYFAWVWDTWGTSCGDLSLITNYDGTAHSPNGTNFKSHLASVLGSSPPPPPPSPSPTPTPTPPPPSPSPSPSPSPAPPLPTNTGSSTNTINVSAAGTYYIWTRMLAADSNSDSYWLQIDGGNGILVGNGAVPFGAWAWVNWHDGSTGNVISANLTSGSHTLKIIGREANTKIDTVVLSPDPVFNPANPEIIDSTPPVVTFSSPSNNATLSGTASVSVNATDDHTVSKVDLLLDNSTVATQSIPSSGSSYSFSLDTTKYSSGSHSLMAKATDLAGNVGSSSILNVTISQPTPTPPPPSPSPSPSPTPTPTPTPSPTPTPPPPPTIVGDLNGDGKVNVLDLSILLRNWNTIGGPADLNHDGIVNIFDLSILLRNWSP